MVLNDTIYGQSLFLYQPVSEDCILPVPSVLTSNGISRIVDLPLIDSEQHK